MVSGKMQKSLRKGRKLNHGFLLECETKPPKPHKKLKRGPCNFFYSWIREKKKEVEKKKNASKKRTEKGAWIVFVSHENVVVCVGFSFLKVLIVTKEKKKGKLAWTVKK